MTSWPLARIAVTSPYGYRTHPISGLQALHRGVDYACSFGTPLLAIGRMRLVAKGSNLSSTGAGHWANWQLVDEPALTFGYWHQNERTAASLGTIVEEGQQLGVGGSTGASTGPHLHLEQYHNGSLMDAHAWLTKATASNAARPPVVEDDGFTESDRQQLAALGAGSLPLAKGYPFPHRDAMQSNLEQIVGLIRQLAPAKGVDPVRLQHAVAERLARRFHLLGHDDLADETIELVADRLLEVS